MLHQGGAGRGGEAAGALPPGPVQGHAGGQALPRPPCPAPRSPGKGCRPKKKLHILRHSLKYGRGGLKKT